MKFIQKHKRLLIIVLIALIIIGVAYYFTLGKPTSQKDTNTSSGGDSAGGSSSSPLPATTSSSDSLGSYPLKWGVYNAFTKTLQNRLNLSITTCKLGSTIAADGILGNQTLTAIKQSFPSIGASVETNRYVTESQYSIIINSKPGCV